MNVWIFQDEPQKSLRAKLCLYRSEEIWWWNVDRYKNKNTAPHIESGDICLLWQTECKNSPAGIYAVGKVIKEPYIFENEKSNWRVDVVINKILEKPVIKNRLYVNRELKDLQILKMPNHIVFYVTQSQWDFIKSKFPELD